MLDWIAEQGVRFQPSLGGTLSLGRTNSFFLGGGRAMLNALYRTAEDLGVRVLYDAPVVGLDIEDGTFRSATVGGDGTQQTYGRRPSSRRPAASRRTSTG
jgi:tricarballylate dehydrogenase